MMNPVRPMRRLAALRPGAPLLACLLSAAALAAPPPERVALTNCRIIPVVGEPIDHGAILMDHGKLSAVAKEADVPYDARVFDLAGKTVMPGLIICHTARGLDIPNENRPIVPQLDAADALDPSQLFFEDCLRNGVTCVHVIPGNNTIIGGLGRIVRPIGMTVAEMTIAPGDFLKLSVSPRFDTDRMFQLASLREAFAELDDYMARLAEQRYEEKKKDEGRSVDVGPAEARKRGRELIAAENVDDQHRNLLRLRGGHVRVGGEEGAQLFNPLGAFVYCANAMDIAPALQVAKEYGFADRLVLVLGGEAYKAIGELKTAARPVVLPPDLLYRETDPLTGKVREVFLPKRFSDAELLWALSPGADDSLSERLLTYQAARCVRGGVPRGDALRAITLNPAKILGLDQRLGSLEVGKDASLIVLSGDPLDYNTVVEKVFIEGLLVYEREKDVRLKRLNADKAEPAGSSAD